MVASCAVLALQQHSLPGFDLQLVVYLVLVESSIRYGEEIKSFIFAKLREVLPNYSLPDYILFLHQLPINDHGEQTSQLWLVPIIEL